MAGKLFALIKKNYKLLVRNRSSGLILVFGPLLLIMLVGLAFNTASPYSIRIAAYSEGYSALTESLLNQLQQKQFTVMKVDAKESCINGVKTNAYNVCAVFPPNLDQEKSGEITFYVDNTKTNLVYAIMDSVSSTVATKSKELTTQMVEAVINVMSITQNELKDKKSIVESMQSSNEDLSKSINSALEETKSISVDFDFETLPISTLEGVLGIDTNTSNDAAIVMARMKAKLNELENQIDTANSHVKKSLNELDATKPAITTNIEYAKSLASSFETIEKSMETAKEAGVGKIVSPLTTRIESVVPEKTNLSYIFPTLIVLIIMFVSMLLASALEIRERTSKIFFKNFITPTGSFMFLSANFLTNLSVVLMQLLVLVTAASLFFKDQLIPVITLLLLVLLITASLFILFGMLIGSIFRSEETSVIAVVSISFILLFFSGTIMPLETLPDSIRTIALLNPFYVSQDLLNKIILFNAPFSSILSHIYILLGTISLLFVLVFFTKSHIQKSI